MIVMISKTRGFSCTKPLLICSFFTLIILISNESIYCKQKPPLEEYEERINFITSKQVLIPYNANNQSMQNYYNIPISSTQSKRKAIEIYNNSNSFIPIDIYERRVSQVSRENLKMNTQVKQQNSNYINQGKLLKNKLNDYDNKSYVLKAKSK